MEPISGYAFLKELRSNVALGSIPLTIMTADARTENDGSKKAGVDDYIVKPFNGPALKAKIDAVFAVEYGQHRFPRVYLRQGLGHRRKLNLNQ
jgi:two-component system chemotaxis response regulator CheY